MCNNFTRMCSNFTVMCIARCETFGQIMFYSVTKCPTCSKCAVHVDNVYVISRTVALTDLQRNVLECYIFIFMCNNFTLMCNNFTTLCSKV
jgi:hypothetical protein